MQQVASSIDFILTFTSQSISIVIIEQFDKVLLLATCIFRQPKIDFSRREYPIWEKVCPLVEAACFSLIYDQQIFQIVVVHFLPLINKSIEILWWSFWVNKLFKSWLLTGKAAFITLLFRSIGILISKVECFVILHGLR